MRNRVLRHFGSGLLLCLTSVCTTYAASPESRTGCADPQIVVGGTAEVLIQPTTASFSVEITTSAPTAATARADGARITQSVMETLKKADLHHDETLSTSLSVGPKWENDETSRRRKRTSFEATNTIELRSDRLDKIGTFLDAALEAGATSVSEVTFSATDSVQARRQALANAVADARRDAETIAHAGGGTLGDLELLSTEDTGPPGVRFEEIQVTAQRRGSVSTELVPSQIKVTAKVVAHWKFVASGTTK